MKEYFIVIYKEESELADKDSPEIKRIETTTNIRKLLEKIEFLVGEEEKFSVSEADCIIDLS